MLAQVYNKKQKIVILKKGTVTDSYKNIDLSTGHSHIYAHNYPQPESAFFGSGLKECVIP